MFGNRMGTAVDDKGVCKNKDIMNDNYKSKTERI